MAAILTRRRRRFGPARAVEIDYANPITQGLAFLNFAGAGALDLVSHATGTLSSAAFVGTLGGDLGCKGGGSTAPITFGVGSRMATSNGSGTGDYTILSVADPDNSAKGGLVAQSNDGSSPSAQCGIIANVDSSFAYASGKVYFYDFTSAVSVCDATASGVLTASRKTRVFAGRCAHSLGTARELFVDGVKVTGGGAGVVNNIYADATGVMVGGLLVGSSSWSATNAAYKLSAGFNRALSDSELAALSDGGGAGLIWALLRPVIRRTYFVVPPAGAAATLKTADGVARASIKTVNGIAIASMKTYDALTP